MKPTPKYLRAFVLAAAALGICSESAQATTNCSFAINLKSKTMVLQGPCQTDETILIPDKLTLNGQGFKITAIDPPGGNFAGPILTNAGTIANVTNLFLRTSTAMADFCQDDANKIVGILINNAVSSISGVNITLNKGAGASVCSEGIAIVAQSLPFSATKPYKKVTIKDSSFNYNQLAGIMARGNLNLRVENNLIRNLDANPNTRHGLVMSEGVKAYVVNNQILRHQHVPYNDDPGYGILGNGIGASTFITNTVNFADVGIRASGGTKITIRANTVRSSSHDGIVLDDVNGINTTGNTLWANDSQKNGLSGIYVRSVNGLVTKNTVKNNITLRNSGVGLATEGSLNKVQANTSSLNTILDMSNVGGNLYSKNLCNTHSGPPITCTVPPAP